MKLSNRELLLTWATGVVVLFGVSYMLCTPKIKDWKKLREEQRDLARRQLQTERLVEQKARWDTRLREQLRELKVYPQDQDPTADILIKLESIVNKAGLKLLSREVNRETPHGQLYELGVDCKWEGNIHGIVAFLFELQQEGAMLDASQLSVSPNEKRVLRGSFTVNSAYCRPVTARTNAVPNIRTEKRNGNRENRGPTAPPARHGDIPL